MDGHCGQKASLRPRTAARTPGSAAALVSISLLPALPALIPQERLSLPRGLGFGPWQHRQPSAWRHVTGQASFHSDTICWEPQEQSLYHTTGPEVLCYRHAAWT